MILQVRSTSKILQKSYKDLINIWSSLKATELFATS